MKDTKGIVCCQCHDDSYPIEKTQIQEHHQKIFKPTNYYSFIKGDDLVCSRNH